MKCSNNIHPKFVYRMFAEFTWKHTEILLLFIYIGVDVIVVVVVVVLNAPTVYLLPVDRTLFSSSSRYDIISSVVYFNLY